MKNEQLDYLKSREQDAFRRKQDAYRRLSEVRERCNNAHAAMQAAWEERLSAKEEMNREFEAMQQESENYRETWNEYGRIRDANNSRIEALRYEADNEHEMMKDCFERASAAYEYGEKSEAKGYALEGHEHKDRRNELNEEIRELVQIIHSAKLNAAWRAPKTDNSRFRSAKSAFESAKARHESAKAEFKLLKSERDRFNEEFVSAKEEHVRLKEEFQRKLEEVKRVNKQERDQILNKAGVTYSERDNAKIVKKSDGTTHVYHGGIGKGDGLGHGHTALDQFGNKTYDRGAFEKHGYQNYTDSKANKYKVVAIGNKTLESKSARIRYRKDDHTAGSSRAARNHREANQKILVAVNKHITERTPHEVELVDQHKYPQFSPQRSFATDEKGRAIVTAKGEIIDVPYGTKNSQRPDGYYYDGIHHVWETKDYTDIDNLKQNIRQQGDLRREALGENADITFSISAANLTVEDAVKLTDFVENKKGFHINYQTK